MSGFGTLAFVQTVIVVLFVGQTVLVSLDWFKTSCFRVLIHWFTPRAIKTSSTWVARMAVWWFPDRWPKCILSVVRIWRLNKRRIWWGTTFRNYCNLGACLITHLFPLLFRLIWQCEIQCVRKKEELVSGSVAVATKLAELTQQFQQDFIVI